MIRTSLIRNQQEMERVEWFAKSFDHKVNPSLQTGILANGDGTQWFGYYQMIQVPIFLVGFHPEIGSGRRCIEAINKLRSWSEFQYGSCYAGINHGSRFEEILKRMEFKDVNLKLFKSEG